jgi:membrane-associated phospholipid phosphatase
MPDEADAAECCRASAVNREQPGQRFRLRVRLAFPLLAASLVAFALLAVRIRGQHPPSWDAYLLRLLAEHGHAQPLRSLFDFALNVVGEYRGLVPAGLLLLGLIVRRRARAAVLNILVLGASAATVIVLKPAFHRPPLIAGREGYFPSTHAAGAFAVGAVLALLAWPTRWRWPILAVSLSFVALYGAALVYSRAHYPSDVVGGWCIALFCASGGALLLARSNLHTAR